jgi:hypothetical protein
LSGFEPTAVKGKWFEVNDLDHSATNALDIVGREIEKIVQMVIRA